MENVGGSELGRAWLSKEMYGQCMAAIRQGQADAWQLKAEVLAAAVLVWWLVAADEEVSISAVVPGGSSSGEMNAFEKCEAQLVDSLSEGLQVGDCWDVKTCEHTDTS